LKKADDKKAEEDAAALRVAADNKAAADLCAAADLKVAAESALAGKTSTPGSIVRRVKDRAASKRLAADTKAAAGFKALADKKAAVGSKTLETFFTPAKAVSGKKVDTGRSSASKTVSVFKATPEKIAADRVIARADMSASYDAECERLDAEYETKAAALKSVVNVRLAAYHRADADFEASHDRLDAMVANRPKRATYKAAFSSKEAEDQTHEFTRQLGVRADSLGVEYHKAYDEMIDAEAKHDQKHVKLFEDASLAWARVEDEELLLDTCL
jgi:hypothetical protein